MDRPLTSAGRDGAGLWAELKEPVTADIHVYFFVAEQWAAGSCRAKSAQADTVTGGPVILLHAAASLREQPQRSNYRPVNWT
ncbi:hypothetical protein RRG08_025447 [Elysia crispata]|uniref:Uncharacterized protein n=1 Tax=Elysia crispata TaxID=231223 RepID=A0AAE0YDV2_9GAST|nr:hypothetical protein RRG08_025447 [Elysia crispata]